MVISGFAALVLVGIAAYLPAPYAVEGPGPATNTLGSVNGKQLISISGRKTYPTSGQLDLTTVGVFGGPGAHLTAPEIIASWFNPTQAVVPVESVFAPQETRKEATQQSKAEMTQSQQSAIAAALTEQKIPYSKTVTVGVISEKSPAKGILEVGDVITAVNGTKADSPQTVIEAVRKASPGDAVAITFTRDGKTSTKQIKTIAQGGNAIIGVQIQRDFSFPFDVKLELDNVGGPSAGTMFAVGIVDRLTPGAMTGGKHIAGTGTIRPDGVVGPIGGIRQKMIGAKKVGADYFLAPAENCGQVVGNIPKGLEVFKVEKLSDAVDAVTAIGKGKTQGLATCAGTTASP